MRVTLLATVAAMLLGGVSAASGADDAPRMCMIPTPSPASSDLLKLLHRSDLEKSEFETEAEYDTRIQRAIGAVTDVRAVVPITMGHYNAETETYRLTGIELGLMFDRFMGVNKSVGLRDWYGARLARTFSDKPGYIGTNAFGVRRKVLRSDVTLYEVAFLGGNLGEDGASVDIPLPRATAKGRLPHLKIVIAGALAAPYVIKSDSLVTPTVSFAVDGNIRHVGLVIEPSCGAVVDTSTGEMLAEFDPSKIQQF